MRDVSRVCALRCVIAIRTVSRGRSASRHRVGRAVTRRRIVDQEKFVKMENVFVVLVSSIPPLAALTSMSARSQHATPAQSVPILQVHSNVLVLED